MRYVLTLISRFDDMPNDYVYIARDGTAIFTRRIDTATVFGSRDEAQALLDERNNDPKASGYVFGRGDDSVKVLAVEDHVIDQARIFGLLDPSGRD